MKRLVILVIVVFIVDLFGCVIYYRHVQNFLKEQPSIHHADAAVVFMGDFNKVTFELTSDTKKRLDQAKRLYQSSKVDWIICIGGNGMGIKYPGSQIMKDYLVENLIPGDSIFHDSLSYDTETNLVEALKIVDHSGLHSIVAVSAPLHLYRISRIVRWDAVAYSPYSYSLSNWSNIMLLYKAVHHEWLAFSIRWILPEKFYHKILHFIRSTLT